MIIFSQNTLNAELIEIENQWNDALQKSTGKNFPGLGRELNVEYLQSLKH